MSKPKIMTDLAQVKAKEEELRQGIEDRGYLSSFISGADLNTFTQNGIYAYSRVSANRPSETYGYLFVSDWGEGFCRQIAQDNDNHCYVRVMGDNVWSDWQQLATTEQIEVLSDKTKNWKSLGYFYVTSEEELKNVIDTIQTDEKTNYELVLNIGFMNSSITSVVGNTGGGQLAISGNITHDGRYGFQQAYGYCIKGKILTRSLVNGIWSEWEVVATTTKTDILLTPSPEYSVVENRSCIINNIFYISCTVTKTDGSNFTPKQLHRVATYPSSIRRSYQALSLGMTYGDARTEDKNICFTTQQEVRRVYIDGMIVL